MTGVANFLLEDDMWIAVALIGVVVIYTVILYNGFVALRNRSRNAWADIDVKLKRRHDLVCGTWWRRQSSGSSFWSGGSGFSGGSSGGGGGWW